VFPVIEGRLLGDVRLLLLSQKGGFGSGPHRHVIPSGGFAQSVGKHGPLGSPATDGADAQKVASTFGQKVRKTKRIVDVRADIRVQKQRGFLWHNLLLRV
jgi:hypothetical protein